jgi:hypothetical protein
VREAPVKVTRYDISGKGDEPVPKRAETASSVAIDAKSTREVMGLPATASEKGMREQRSRCSIDTGNEGCEPS